MPLEGTYEPGTWDYSNDHVERYEKSNGTTGLSISGKPVVVLWTRGRKTGAVRKTPVMKVQDGDRYAAVGSKGGSATHPEWYLNLLAHPEVTVQDGPSVRDYLARVATPEERAHWWPIAVEAFPMYATYQSKTEREIPLVILDPL
jgi:deazaflavin-dependent oxidoreductase (nitroreductase family)